MQNIESFGITAAVVIDRQDHDDPEPGVWPEVVERLSENPQASELPLRVLLDDLLRREANMNNDDLARCGVAARRQLDYLSEHPPTAVTRLVIDAVVWTASTDPVATERLLRRAIEPERLRDRGAEDSTPSVMQCRNSHRIPSFVADLYVAVMEYDEDSNEATQLVGGSLLPLTSTCRQDVEHAKWNLVRHFRSFLQTAPQEALRVLVLSRTDQTWEVNSPSLSAGAWLL